MRKGVCSGNEGVRGSSSRPLFVQFQYTLDRRLPRTIERCMSFIRALENSVASVHRNRLSIHSGWKPDLANFSQDQSGPRTFFGTAGERAGATDC